MHGTFDDKNIFGESCEDASAITEETEVSAKSNNSARNRPFLNPIFSIFGLLMVKLFRTFESILLGVSCYNRVRTPFLCVCTEPRVSSCVSNT